jgi:hypothetical protein
MLLTRTLTRVGVLPQPDDPWPPPVRRLSLEGHGSVAVIRAAELPAPTCSVKLAGLPRPDGGILVVSVERLPFHRSPGRWHWRCPCCAELKGVLVEVSDTSARSNPAARLIGWACRTCAGLPKSRAWGLSSSQRLDNTLERAAEAEVRRPGENARDWRRRRQRAALSIAKARELDGKTVKRLVERALS